MSEENFQFVVRKGPQPGQVIPLLSDLIIIGRDPMSDIVLTDPEVSRQHARLRETETGYQIQDLGSTNGTFVNGKRLGGEPVTLEPGQEVMLGSGVTMLYQRGKREDILAALSETSGGLGGEKDLPEAEGEGRYDHLFKPPTEEPEEESPVDLPAEETAYQDQFAPPPASEADGFADEFEFAEEDPFTPMAESPAAEADEFTEDFRSQVDPFEPVEQHLMSRSEPEAQAKPARPSTPPPYVSPAGPQRPPEPEKKGRRTLTIILVAVFLLICCCCAFLLSAYYWWGDLLMQELGVY